MVATHCCRWPAGYRERTRRNVIDSHGTVILYSGALTGGSRAMAGDCRRYDKPCLTIDADLITAGEAALLLAVFILRYRILILNVAGPRASSRPEIYDFVCDVLMRLLSPPAKRRRKS